MVLQLNVNAEADIKSLLWTLNDAPQPDDLLANLAGDKTKLSIAKSQLVAGEILCK